MAQGLLINLWLSVSFLMVVYELVKGRGRAPQPPVHSSSCPPPHTHTQSWAWGSHSDTSLCSAGLLGFGPSVSQSIPEQAFIDAQGELPSEHTTNLRSRSGPVFLQMSGELQLGPVAQGFKLIAEHNSTKGRPECLYC